MSNRSVNATCAPETPTDIADLQSQYDQLIGSLAEVVHLRWAIEENPGAAEQTFEQRHLHIHDQLHSIAKDIANRHVGALAAAALKARVLLDWCEHDRDDVVTKLTISLCREVLEIAGTGNNGVHAP
jgi:hypothetical protein